LITDIIDEARNRNASKTSDTAALYGNKSRGVPRKKDKDKSKEQKKESNCKGCGQPNPKHAIDNCL
jgi:hypothetical protein